MTYGITPEGFVRPSHQELLDERNADQLATISPGLDQSSDSILGGVNAIGTRQLSVAWEALQTCADALDPDKAEDFLLEALAKLTGTRREGATKSVVPVSANLDDGTVLLAGTHFAHVQDKPSVRFTPLVDITADVGDGVYTGVFVAEQTGPVAADTGTLTVIATSVVGWNTITNTSDATLGKVANADPTLRLNREAQVAAAGTQTAAAIKADLKQLGSWIKSVEVFENYSHVEDEEGRPPHSFEVLVYDEGGPLDADDKIAQVIWKNKPSGIQSWGVASDEGAAQTENGQEVVVPFSRVTEVPIYVGMTLTTEAGFADTAGVKSYVATEAGKKYAPPGTDVVALFVRGLPLDVEGVLDVPTFAIGTSHPPVSAVNIPMGIRQVATFDTADIDIS